MTPKRWPVYRGLRIVFAIARVLPRYWLLMAREYLGHPAPQHAGDRTHEAAAEQIRRLALALEGALIKVAQIAGARADLFPKPFIDKLSQFHDAVPPRPWSALAPLVEAELGVPLAAVFASVNPTGTRRRFLGAGASRASAGWL